MTAHQDMSLERRQVVRAMEAMGWTAFRYPTGKWKFTNAERDVVRVSQRDLSWNWLRQHDPGFQAIVQQLWLDTYPIRFAKTIKEIAP